MFVDLSNEMPRSLSFRATSPNHTIERSVLAMKNTTPFRMRLSRFITNRYAYRTQPNYLCELVAFAFLVLTAILPFFALAHAMAATR